jgi:hypothetical protein
MGLAGQEVLVFGGNTGPQKKGNGRPQQPSERGVRGRQTASLPCMSV